MKNIQKGGFSPWLLLVLPFRQLQHVETCVVCFWINPIKDRFGLIYYLSKCFQLRSLPARQTKALWTDQNSKFANEEAAAVGKYGVPIGPSGGKHKASSAFDKCDVYRHRSVV